MRCADMRPQSFRSAPGYGERQGDALFRPISVPFLHRKGWHRLKSITYYGQQITVSDEVAEFLERDRLRDAAMRRQEQRHVNYVGFDIATVPDLFTDEPSDPTFEQAFRNLRKQDLRSAYQTLSDDDRKLLCLYYYHELTMEQIGRRYGVTKMAISKRLRKIQDHLRSLMEHEAP